MSDIPGITTKSKTDVVFLLNESQNVPTIISAVAIEDATAGPNSDGIIAKGTVMGIITASGLWAEYDEDGVDDGREVAAGVINHEVDVSDGNGAVNIVRARGDLDESELTGIDANGKTDLAALFFLFF